MIFAFIILMMILLDRALPMTLRSYGVGVFPWADVDRTRALYRGYGWIKLPRTLFLAAWGAVMALSQVFPKMPELWTGLSCIALVLWAGVAFRDAWRARGENPGH